MRRVLDVALVSSDGLQLSCCTIQRNEMVTRAFGELGLQRDSQPV